MEQTHRVRAQPRARVAHRITGGVRGNSRLTAATAAILIVLLAIEGATIPFLGSLLTVHVFVGMLLLGPVALKLASTGFRVLSYYSHRREYVAQGPPPPLMRVIVAPILIASTIALLGTGVALVAFGSRAGTMLGLHKASFIVWVAAMSIHVLWHIRGVARDAFADLGRRRLGGAGLRATVLLGALAAGAVIAILTLPLAGSWAHWASTGGRH
jgi:hypothetical protein